MGIDRGSAGEEGSPAEHPFPELLDRLIQHVPLRPGDDSSGPIDPCVLRDWRRWWRQSIGEVVDGLFAAEYRAWRSVQWSRAGDGATSDRDLFAEQVSDSNWAWLGERYPVAARLCASILDQGVAAAGQLHRDVIDDRRVLRNSFGISSGDAVVGIRPGRGDRHDGGRTVVLVSFAGGGELVYKPRSVRPEAVLDDLVRHVAIRTGDPGWPPLATVDRPDHGWMSVVRPTPPENRAAAELFFRRAGILLAVASVLGMHDLHHENLIAAGNRPVVVDAETILPATCAGRPSGDADPAADHADRTVLGTGLLPRPVPVYRQRTDLAPDAVTDIGGLDEVPSQHRQVRRWRWHGDDLIDVLLDVTTPGGSNLPLGQVDLAAPERGRAVVGGFGSAIAVLRHDRRRSLQDHDAAAPALLAPAYGVPVRVVPRNTSTYAAALRSATSPAALRSEHARLAALRQRLGDGPGVAMAALRRAELAALQVQDIPRFVAAADQVEVVACGRSTPIRLALPPAQQSRARLAMLSDDWVADQTDLIRATFSPVFPAGEVQPGKAAPLSGPAPTTIATRVADLAELILTRRRTGPDGIGWITVQRDEPSNTLLAGPAGWGLRHGAAGIALFLADAGVRLGRREWIDTAHTLLDQVATGARRVMDEATPRSGAPLDLGLDAGLGGAIWCIAHCAAVTGYERLLDSAGEIAEAVSSRPLAPGSRLDAGGGLSGLLVGLVELAQAPESSRSGLADRCGTALLAAMTDRPAGRRGLTTPAQAWSVVEALSRWHAVGGRPSALETAAAVALSIVRYEAGHRVTRVGHLRARVAAVLAMRNAGSSAGVAQDLEDCPFGATIDLADHSLDRGIAGLLEAKCRLGLSDTTLLTALDVDVDRLRLVGPDVAPWLLPGLADGLAGVGMALLAGSRANDGQPMDLPG